MLGIDGEGVTVLKISDLMTVDFMTLSPEDKVDRAVFLFHYEKIHHLPVVTDDGKLLGMLSQHDLRKIGDIPKHRIHESQDGKLQEVSNRKVRMLMRRQPFTIGPNESVEAAAKTMATEQIGSLPVIEDDKLVGIITSTHLLSVMAEVFQLLPEGTALPKWQSRRTAETA